MKNSLISMIVFLTLAESMILANMGPPEPSPGTRPFPTPDLTDVAPELPEPDENSPVPMVIAGLAAAAGVALLGLWIANRARSTNSLNEQGNL